jgi:hypothetical protein
MQHLYLCSGLTRKYIKRMISKTIHVMPKSMAMTSSGRGLLSDMIENTGTRKNQGGKGEGEENGGSGRDGRKPNEMA